jgi:hypothetical protein
VSSKLLTLSVAFTAKVLAEPASGLAGPKEVTLKLAMFWHKIDSNVNIVSSRGKLKWVKVSFFDRSF